MVAPSTTPNSARQRARTARAGRRAPRRLGGVAAGILVMLTVSGCSPERLTQGLRESLWEALPSTIAQAVSWSFSNQFTTLTDSAWGAIFDQAMLWAGVFMVVAIAVGALEVVLGLLTQNVKRVLAAWVFTALAWPLTLISLLLFRGLSGAVNELAVTIATSIVPDEVAQGTYVELGDAIWARLFSYGPAGTAGVWFIEMGLYLGVIFASLVMIAVFFVVMLGTAVAGAFSPVALMLAGFRSTKQMSGKWAQMVVSLLLSQPLAAGFVTLGIALGATASEGGTFGVLMMMIAMLWMAAAAPFIAYSLVGFCGVQIAAAGAMLAGKLKAARSAATGAVKGAGAIGGANSISSRLGAATESAMGKVGPSKGMFASPAKVKDAQKAARTTGTATNADTQGSKADDAKMTRAQRRAAKASDDPQPATDTQTSAAAPGSGKPGADTGDKPVDAPLGKPSPAGESAAGDRVEVDVQCSCGGAACGTCGTGPSGARTPGGAQPATAPAGTGAGAPGAGAALFGTPAASGGEPAGTPVTPPAPAPTGGGGIFGPGVAGPGGGGGITGGGSVTGTPAPSTPLATPPPGAGPAVPVPPAQPAPDPAVRRTAKKPPAGGAGLFGGEGS